MSAAVDHLHVLVKRLLPLKPHLLIELLDERLHSPVQLVLTQRRLSLGFSAATWRRAPGVGTVVEGF